MGYYLFPFSIVLLWFLTDSRKTKYLLLVALVLLSMICMFLEEACCPSREYPWDCMVECIFKGILVPLLCLLGYTVYVFCVLVFLPEKINGKAWGLWPWAL